MTNFEILIMASSPLILFLGCLAKDYYLKRNFFSDKGN